MTRSYQLRTITINADFCNQTHFSCRLTPVIAVERKALATHIRTRQRFASRDAHGRPSETCHDRRRPHTSLDCRTPTTSATTLTLILFRPNLLCLLQDKGLAPRQHLHETVENMKTFNARRKLKVSFLSTQFSKIREKYFTTISYNIPYCSQ